MRARVWCAGLLAVEFVALAGCADDGPSRAARPPSTSTATSTSAAATDLAPSQVAASTVAPPAGVPLCDVADLQFTSAGEPVILIHNVGSVECEVDVSDSPNRDPLMEPSVWVHPDGDAELAVAANDSQCEQPAPVTSIDLIVNGEAVQAPVTLAATCDVTLTAIYTAD